MTKAMTRTTFAQPSGLSELAAMLAGEVEAAIKDANINSTRSLKPEIGPSEMGIECLRRMAYRLLLWAKVNKGGGSWATDIGKAVHAYMETVFRYADPDPGRYLIEQGVTIRGGITGTADLFDRLRHMVIDWKVVGESALVKYRRNGPGSQYETQAHLYGYGFEQRGERVESVAIVFLPRSHTLDGLYVWVAPYDRQVALDALDRLDGLLDLLGAMDVESHPDRWSMVPATPGESCKFCPWFLPNSTDLSIGCPGATA